MQYTYILKCGESGTTICSNTVFVLCFTGQLKEKKKSLNGGLSYLNIPFISILGEYYSHPGASFSKANLWNRCPGHVLVNNMSLS